MPEGEWRSGSSNPLNIHISHPPHVSTRISRAGGFCSSRFFEIWEGGLGVCRGSAPHTETVRERGYGVYIIRLNTRPLGGTYCNVGAPHIDLQDWSSSRREGYALVFHFGMCESRAYARCKVFLSHARTAWHLPATKQSKLTVVNI